jgi:hypothetical protein
MSGILLVIQSGLKEFIVGQELGISWLAGWLAGQCSVTSNYKKKKNYLLFRAGSSVWGVLTGLLLT